MFITGGTSRVGGDQLRVGRLIVAPLPRTPAMTTTTPTKSTTNKTKSNGEEHSHEPAASTNPTPSPTTAPDKKPVTVMIPEALHRKVKVLAELSGTSLSDLVETEMKALVKTKLPGLLAGLDAEG